MANDNVLGFLREARAALLEEKDANKGSRAASICLTEIDTAILWRQEDLRLKEPFINEERTFAPIEKKSLDVYSNENCVFQYCPHPDECKAVDGCLCSKV